MMSARSEALKQIASIAAANNLSLDDIAAALTEKPEDTSQIAEQKAGIASQIFAYIGGILAFSGIVVFIGMQWDSMNAFARVVITLGTGIALYVFAIVAAEKNRNSKAITPLFLLSNIFQPTGFLVLLHEFSSGGDPRYAVLLVSFIMAVQQALTFSKQRFSVLLFFAICFGGIFFTSLFDILEVYNISLELAIGLSLCMVSYGISRHGYKTMSGFFYLVGSIIFLAACYRFVENTFIEPVFAALAAFTVYLSVVVRSRVLLSVGAISFVAYIGEYSFDHFANSIGWPITLIFMGLVFIGISFLAMRLNKRIKTAA